MNIKEALIVSITFFGVCSLLLIWSLLLITYWREWQAKQKQPSPGPKKKKRIVEDQYEEDDDDIIIEE